MVGEPRVGGELGPFDDLAHGRPVLPGLEARERQVAPVLGLVVGDEGIGPEAVGRRPRHRDVHQQRQRHCLAHRPEPGAEQRHVDDGRLARAFAVEERAHDPAGDGHRADRVAEAGAGRVGHVVVVGALDPERDARATPERERVVRALVGVGSACALTRAPHVDDLRVVRPNVVDLDAQLREHARELVREEHVGGRDELGEDLETLVGREVEREALLPPVGVLEQRMHVGGNRDGSRRRETAHGVAALDVLDLDHLGTPVGQQRRRRGHERVLRHFQDAHAFHHCSHRSPLMVSVT